MKKRKINIDNNSQQDELKRRHDYQYEDTATYNSTLVKWRGSRQICKSQFHS